MATLRSTYLEAERIGPFDFFDVDQVVFWKGPGYSCLRLKDLRGSSLHMSLGITLAKTDSADSGHEVTVFMDGRNDLTVTNAKSCSSEWAIRFVNFLCVRLCEVHPYRPDRPPQGWRLDPTDA
ncbi:LH1 [Bearded dragon adenovirus 1]|uniref:LH1 n=1 Tax=Bearded dragon adenovirus 1 TaxID=2729647 RepID=A0A6M4MIY4_9ADEN|nr:LH1 [Bearded dragon adenovirus 1]QJR83084.1 LH1 [Bearded dragon adenovirus 1]QPN96202.1 LH1 [Bearded dragon adenovirus 1]